MATAERSFSELTLIKKYLRLKMSQSRLSNLSILSIENDEAKAVDKSVLMKQFAAVNAVRERKF